MIFVDSWSNWASHPPAATKILWLCHCSASCPVTGIMHLICFTVTRIQRGIPQSNITWQSKESDVMVSWTQKQWMEWWLDAMKWQLLYTSLFQGFFKRGMAHRVFCGVFYTNFKNKPVLIQYANHCSKCKLVKPLLSSLWQRWHSVTMLCWGSYCVGCIGCFYFYIRSPQSSRPSPARFSSLLSLLF